MVGTLVCSIRIQQQLFSLLGISEATALTQFGHMLAAFEYGAPPHGGIAPGIDRIVMILAEESSIREVTAVSRQNPPRLSGKLYGRYSILEP